MNIQKIERQIKFLEAINNEKVEVGYYDMRTLHKGS